jgi:hypothetical protein
MSRSARHRRRPAHTCGAVLCCASLGACGRAAVNVIGLAGGCHGEVGREDRGGWCGRGITNRALAGHHFGFQYLCAVHAFLPSPVSLPFTPFADPHTCMPTTRMNILHANMQHVSQVAMQRLSRLSPQRLQIHHTHTLS